MATAVALRTDFSAVELRRLAAASKNANQSRRLLSLAAVRDGMNRTEAARIGGMDRQTLRDWVHRYNALGLAGLADRKAPGASPRLSPSQMREVAELVRQGPDPAVHGVVRWRRIDLSRLIEERWGVTLAERSVGDLLRRLGVRRMSVRPRCPEQDIAAQEAHKKTSPTWSPPASRPAHAASRSSSGGRTKRVSASRAR